MIEIFMMTEVQVTISIIVSVFLGILVKRKIDYNNLLPTIHLIISLILKAENTKEVGQIKKTNVSRQLFNILPQKQKTKLIRKFGSLGNAIQYTLEKFGQPIIRGILNKIKK